MSRCKECGDGACICPPPKQRQELPADFTVKPLSSGDFEKEGTSERATAQQVGGSHYKGFAIQPAEFIHKNGLGFLAGNVIKYVCRHGAKNGREDLLKARHYIDLLIEHEYGSDTPK